MPLMTQYVLKEYLKFLGLLVGALSIIFFTIHFLEKSRFFSQADAPFFVITQYLLLKIPKMILELMPISMLLAALLTLGTLSKNNEVVPIMNAGVGLLGIAAPLLFIGGAVSILFFLLNGSFIPFTQAWASAVHQEKIERRDGAVFLKNKIWFRINANTLLYTQLVNAKENTLYGVHLYYLGDKTPITKEIEAESLRHEHGQWVLHRGVRLHYQKNRSILRIPFEREEIQLSKTLFDMQQTEVRPNEMSYAKLSSYVDEMKNDKLNAIPYQVALHSNMAFPFANFIMTLLGIPLSFSYLRKGGMGKNIMAGLGVALLYWLVLSIALSLGRLQTIPPFLAGWGGHFLFFVLGLFLFFNCHRR